MEIYAKIGTKPQTVVRVKSKRKAPKKGDRIQIQKAFETQGKYEYCIVDDVVDAGGYSLYFLSLM